MTKLRLAYFGSPFFSAFFLERLLTEGKTYAEVDFVVTQPDRKVGRKQILTPSPVKIVAKKYNLDVLELEGPKLNKNLELRTKNLDFCLLYAFGQIIPKELLDLPKLGFINVHPSLLPKYRGPAPIAYPLINGDQKTGVTLMKMDDKIDHGPIITQEELIITPNDRRPDLEKKLTDLAYKMFINIIKDKEKHGFKSFRQQNHEEATYTKLLTKQDGFINFKNLELKIKNSPKQLFNLFRGLYPWPGIWTTIKINEVEKRLKITDVKFEDNQFVIEKVQLEGKREVDFPTFQRAYQF